MFPMTYDVEGYVSKDDKNKIVGMVIIQRA